MNMKKVLRLTESELIGLVGKVINEKKGTNSRQKHYRYDEENKSIYLENGDQSDMDKILSELPEDIKFLLFWNCDGFADFSNINICELPEIIFVNLRGTKNNFEELFDCYEKMGNDMYDLAKPDPPYFKDDRISDVPEPRFSMNESVLKRLVKKIINEEKKQKPKFFYNGDSMQIEFADSNYIKEILQQLPKNMMFLGIRNSEFADFSGINLCDYPDLMFVTLKGTKNNLEEQNLDCFESWGDGMFDRIEQPEPHIYQDEKTKSLPYKKGLSMNETKRRIK